jgi:hypothetical protein
MPGVEIILQYKNKWAEKGRNRRDSKGSSSIKSSVKGKGAKKAQGADSIKGANYAVATKSNEVSTRNIGHFKNNNEMVKVDFLKIKSIDDLIIDNSKLLSYKKGDLNLIHTRSWRCCLKNDDKPLILKQFDCLDENVYSMKMHEGNLMLTNRTHPNLVNMLSTWKTESPNSFTFKVIYMVFEECIHGNFQDSVIPHLKTIKQKVLYKHICGLAKALNYLHHNDIVHGGIRANNLLINHKNDAIIGQIKKSDTESMRKARHLFSQFSMDTNLNDYFIYWAPELLLDQPISKASDVWSFGIVIFILMTGEIPYNIMKKENAFNSIISGFIKWELLDKQPKMKNLLKNMLSISVESRWTSDKVYSFFQADFAVVIQRFWKGTYARIKFRRECMAILKLQSWFRGHLTRMKIKKQQYAKKYSAALRIQRMFRNFKNSKKYRFVRKKVTQMQARVLARQTRRAFLKLRVDTITCQMFIRRLLSYTSYTCVKMQKLGVVKDIAGINGNFNDINKMAGLYFRGDFLMQTTNYDGGSTQNNLRSNDQSKQNDYDIFGQSKKQMSSQDQAQLQLALGPKFDEFEPEIEQIKSKLKQANKLYTLSNELPITIITKQNPDIWQKTVEPFNVMENVLKPDNSIYRNLKPEIEFNLCNNEVCHIAEIIVKADKPKPGETKVFTSMDKKIWTLIGRFGAQFEETQKLIPTGEQYAKYLKIHFTKNTNGGGFVSIKQITIRGIRKTLIK